MRSMITLLSTLAIPTLLFGCNNISVMLDQSGGDGDGDGDGCGCETDPAGTGGGGKGGGEVSSSSSGAGGKGGDEVSSSSSCTGGTGGAGGAGGKGGGEASSSSSGAGGDPNPLACQCPPGFTSTPAGDTCVMTTTVDPTASPITHDVCHIWGHGAYGVYGAKVETGGAAPGLATSAVDYWKGRLNEAGVWACLPGSDLTGQTPTDEWIGFSVCVDIAESGDYILGIAGDNNVNIHVDGNTVVDLGTSAMDNFRFWHLRPIHLTSGVHVIELRGENDGEAAGFGAEISGPFPSGSIDTDAEVLDENAYASHLYWSTKDLQPGQTFQLGENSGWQCPGNAALNLCSPKPVCSTVLYKECMAKP